MTSLVSPADVRALINTSLSDANLQAVIDRVEAQVNWHIGEPQNDSGTVEHVLIKHGEGELLFMPVEILSITSIVEDETTLETTDYQTWSAGVIERLPSGSHWGERVTVTYKPVDDRLKRKQVIIDLARLVIERTAQKAESVGGEYSYTAPDNWELEFRRAMKRLTFQAI